MALGAGAAEAFDQPGVEVARPGPLPADLGERRLVDGDDHGALLGGAHRLEGRGDVEDAPFDQPPGGHKEQRGGEGARRQRDDHDLAEGALAPGPVQNRTLTEPRKARPALGASGRDLVVIVEQR